MSVELVSVELVSVELVSVELVSVELVSVELVSNWCQFIFSWEDVRGGGGPSRC